MLNLINSTMENGLFYFKQVGNVYEIGFGPYP